MSPQALSDANADVRQSARLAAVVLERALTEGALEECALPRAPASAAMPWHKTGSTRLKNTTPRPRIFFIVIFFDFNGLKLAYYFFN